MVTKTLRNQLTMTANYASPGLTRPSQANPTHRVRHCGALGRSGACGALAQKCVRFYFQKGVRFYFQKGVPQTQQLFICCSKIVEQDCVHNEHGSSELQTAQNHTDMCIDASASKHDSKLGPGQYAQLKQTGP